MCGMRGFTQITLELMVGLVRARSLIGIDERARGTPLELNVSSMVAA